MPGDEEEDEVREQLLVVERLPVELAVHENRDHVVARFAPTVVEQTAQVRPERGQGVVGVAGELERELLVRVRAVHEPDDVARHTLEDVAILARDAEDVRDHRRREGVRERRHEIGRGLVVDIGQELVDDRLDPRTQAVDRLGREPGLEQTAQARVLRRDPT